jgi:hypothetical protein
VNWMVEVGVAAVPSNALSASVRYRFSYVGRTMTDAKAVSP